MVDKKALRILAMLRDRQMSRIEIAEALHEEMPAVNDMIELLHSRFQYVRMTLVCDGADAGPPAPKYTLTLAGRAYLFAVSQAVCCQMALTMTVMLAFAGSVALCRYLHKRTSGNDSQ